MRKLSLKTRRSLWITLIAVLALALILTIILIVGRLSHLHWSLFKTEQKSAQEQVAVLPDAYSVYTGLPLTKKQADQRAIGVMIADDPITRPQSGLGVADVVIEMEAASGITRFLAVFQSDYPKEIGSIRSVRNDYIDLAKGLDAVLVHWGGEKKALNRLSLGGVDEINEFSQGDLFYRKPGVPPPHDGFTTGDLMQTGLERLNYQHAPRFSAWSFKDEPATQADQLVRPDQSGQNEPIERPASGQLTINLGNPNFNVTYAYDGVTNTYLRSQGGQAHKEALTGQQIAPKNILVMRAERFTYDPIGGYLQFDIQRGGACTLFTNGTKKDCHWQKGSESQPLRFLDLAERPLNLTRGQTYIQVLPAADLVIWSAAAKSAN